MANTITYNKHDYVMRLRDRINQPTTWKEVLNVKYSNTRTIVNSSMTLASEAVLASGTRGSAYTYDDIVLAADTLTISTYNVIPMFVDEADRFQQTYVDQMGIADYQAQKTNEKLEALTLAEHASWTDFGVTDLNNTGDDDTTAITVSASNVDDIVRAIKRKIYSNNGVEFATEKGIFIVWRPEDFEFLEAFVQANGFTEADIALKNGIPVARAFKYLGVEHYLSTNHTANHVFAGVKRMGELGILQGTFGKVKFIEDPAKISGLGIVSRVDHGFNWPTYNKEFFMDINVA